MALTEVQARNKVIAEARKWVGYNPGKTYSEHGAWYGLPYALWCAAFASRMFHDGLGATDALKVSGVQGNAPRKRGWIWTVAMLEWAEANCTKVSLRNSQPGDWIFFKYETTGSRNENRVNHVRLVEANHASLGFITGIGGNEPRPGTKGDPSNGRGVWRSNLPLSDPFVVAVYRPRWSAITGGSKPAPTPPRASGLRGFPASASRVGNDHRLSWVIQWVVGRKRTGKITAADVTAIKAQQRKTNVTADGILGINTARAYMGAAIRLYGNLRRGSTGQAVALLQYRIGVPLHQIDGVWGAQTDTYMRAAQRSAGINDDAVFGPNSLARLFAS